MEWKTLKFKEELPNIENIEMLDNFTDKMESKFNQKEYDYIESCASSIKPFSVRSLAKNVYKQMMDYNLEYSNFVENVKNIGLDKANSELRDSILLGKEIGFNACTDEKGEEYRQKWDLNKKYTWIQ